MGFEYLFSYPGIMLKPHGERSDRVRGTPPPNRGRACVWLTRNGHAEDQGTREVAELQRRLPGTRRNTLDDWQKRLVKFATSIGRRSNTPARSGSASVKPGKQRG